MPPLQVFRKRNAQQDGRQEREPVLPQQRHGQVAPEAVIVDGEHVGEIDQGVRGGAGAVEDQPQEDDGKHIDSSGQARQPVAGHAQNPLREKEDRVP